MREGGEQAVPNPYGEPAAMAVSLRHNHADASLRARAANGDTALWPLVPHRLLPGLTVRSGPRNAVYDVNGGPVVAEGSTDALLRLLLLAPGGLATPIVCHAMPAEGPAWDALQRLAQEKLIRLDTIATWDRAMLRRHSAPDAAAYLATFVSPRHRKRNRKKRRILEMQGALALHVASRPAEVITAVEAFCALEAQGWKGRNGTGLSQDITGHAYVRDVMQGMAAADSAFVATLTLADRTIAAGLFLRTQGEVVFWKTAFDETLAKQSPGVIFDLMLTEWLYAQPWFERLDTGHDDSINPDNLIWKQRRRMAYVVIDAPGGTLKGRIARLLLALRRDLRSWNHRRQAAK